MPKASRVFKSKKVTKEEAKKLKPLTGYWSKRLKQARNSDNWAIFWKTGMVWFLIGFLAGRI